MENIQHKLKANKTMKRFLYSYVTIFVIFFLSLFILLESFRFVEKKMKINENKDIVKKELNKLEDSIYNKNKEIEKLSTGEGQEIYFKETLPVAAPDEKVVVLYKPINSPLTIMPAPTDSIWKEIKNRVNYFVDTYTNL